jgi:hypothetical protein
MDRHISHPYGRNQTQLPTYLEPFVVRHEGSAHARGNAATSELLSSLDTSQGNRGAIGAPSTWNVNFETRLPLW